MSSKNKQSPDSVENIEVALTRTEQFIENNQNTILIVVAALVLVVGGYLGYNRIYLKNQEEAARSQMFVAEQYFQRDSFNLVINGDGNYPGVLDIIDDYGMTQSANLGHYYAGISYLNLGDYDAAIEHLKDFNSGDLAVGPVAEGAIGDAYWEKGEVEEAARYYMRAAEMRENNFTAPLYFFRAGLAYEKMGDTDKAYEAFEKIKKEYPNSAEARDIDKYLARVK